MKTSHLRHSSDPPTLRGSVGSTKVPVDRILRISIPRTGPKTVEERDAGPYRTILRCGLEVDSR